MAQTLCWLLVAILPPVHPEGFGAGADEGDHAAAQTGAFDVVTYAPTYQQGTSDVLALLHKLDDATAGLTPVRYKGFTERALLATTFNGLVKERHNKNACGSNEILISIPSTHLPLRPMWALSDGR